MPSINADDRGISSGILWTRVIKELKMQRHPLKLNAFTIPLNMELCLWANSKFEISFSFFFHTLAMQCCFLFNWLLSLLYWRGFVESLSNFDRSRRTLCLLKHQSHKHPNFPSMFLYLYDGWVWHLVSFSARYLNVAINDFSDRNQILT